MACDIATRLGMAPTQDMAFVKGVVLRTQWFDRVADAFLRTHADAQVFSLGAGLCTRWRRLQPLLPATSAIDWLNVDLPDVIAWRNHCVPMGEREANLASSVLEPAWLDQVKLTAGRPVLVLLEGVCPYLPQVALEQWLAHMAERLNSNRSHAWLVFDFIDPALLHRPMQVEGIVLPVQSGFTSPDQVTRLHPALQIVACEHPFAKFSDGHRQFDEAFFALHDRRPYTWTCLSLGAPA
jgi:O-methyltransferase involved in polyketide biosynthesis